MAAPAAATAAWLARIPADQRIAAHAFTDWRLAAWAIGGLVLLGACLILGRTGAFARLRDAIEAERPRPWVTSAALTGLLALILATLKALIDAATESHADQILGAGGGAAAGRQPGAPGLRRFRHRAGRAGRGPAGAADALADAANATRVAAPAGFAGRRPDRRRGLAALRALHRTCLGASAARPGARWARPADRRDRRSRARRVRLGRSGLRRRRDRRLWPGQGQRGPLDRRGTSGRGAGLHRPHHGPLCPQRHPGRQRRARSRDVAGLLCHQLVGCAAGDADRARSA